MRRSPRPLRALGVLAIAGSLWGACDSFDPISEDRCGNAVIEVFETCDDGNAIDGDGCTACVADLCGDTLINNAGQESCDDGNIVDGDGCSSACAVDYGYTCTGQPSRSYSDASSVTLQPLACASAWPWRS